MNPNATEKTGRVILTVLVAAAVMLTPLTAEAQGEYNSHRKWWYAAIGAVVVGGATFALTGDLEAGSGCSSQACITAVSTVMAGGVGFLLGRDVDRKRERRFRAGPSLRYDYENFGLGMVPDRLTGFPGGAAVVGLGGARIVMKDGTTRARGLGVRGIEDVAVFPASDLMVLSTPTSLIAFPIRDDEGQGTVIDEQGGGAMETVNDNLAVASRDSLRMLALRMRDEEISTETMAGFETFDYVADMAFSSYDGLTWVLTDDVLTAYNSDLEMVGEVILPAPGRTVRVQGSRLVVAAGTNGVFIVDATDPETPEVVGEFTGVRFAYSADIDGDLVYVAAGNEGVAVIDASDPQVELVGVAREVRFASDVAVTGDSELWILDREGRLVQRAEIEVAN